MSETRGRFFAHPLLGAELPVLLRLVAENGLPRPARWPQAGAALGSALLRWPVARYEHWRAGRMLPRSAMPPPLFIVGHWRSGTTHLCNVLHAAPRYGCVSPVAAGMPGELLTIGRAFGAALQRGIPRDRLIDRVPVQSDSPQEDEFGIANLLPLSFLHGLYFPRQLCERTARGLFFDGCTATEVARWRGTVRAYLRKVCYQQGGRTLLVRNPVYTARVAELPRLFPGCKILHIHRDPFRLFSSMRNYYRKLLPALAWQPWDEGEVERCLLESCARMMDRLLAQVPRLPAGCYHASRWPNSSVPTGLSICRTGMATGSISPATSSPSPITGRTSTGKIRTRPSWCSDIGVASSRTGGIAARARERCPGSGSDVADDHCLPEVA